MILRLGNPLGKGKFLHLLIKIINKNLACQIQLQFEKVNSQLSFNLLVDVPVI